MVRVLSHIRVRVPFGLGLFLAAIVLIFFYHHYDSRYSLIIKPIMIEGITNNQSTKKVLIYTTMMMNSDSWWFGSELGNRPFQNCQIKDCELITDVNQYLKSLAVLFYIVNTHGLKQFNAKIFNTARLPKEKPSNQVWVLANVEPTLMFHTNLGPEELQQADHVFNWTMDYRTNSDIWTPYGKTLKRPKPLSLIKFTPKSKMALSIISNCRKTSYDRLLLVKDLQKYTQDSVDLYGDCGKPYPCGKSNYSCFVENTKHYKFYFAFENYECQDYVTEKFWRALLYGVVPVVIGASRNFYEKYAPPNSFIYAPDFITVKELANYLMMLDKNKSEYMKYLEWQKDYTVECGLAGSLCTLCAKLHDQNIPKQSLELSKWWAERQCPNQSMKSRFNSE